MDRRWWPTVRVNGSAEEIDRFWRWFREHSPFPVQGHSGLKLNNRPKQDGEFRKYIQVNLSEVKHEEVD